VRFVYGIRSNGGYGDFLNLSTVTVTDANLSPPVPAQKIIQI
jgi:hypothetical protein